MSDYPNDAEGQHETLGGEIGEYDAAAAAHRSPEEQAVRDEEWRTTLAEGEARIAAITALRQKGPITDPATMEGARFADAIEAANRAEAQRMLEAAPEAEPGWVTVGPATVQLMQNPSVASDLLALETQLRDGGAVTGEELQMAHAATATLYQAAREQVLAALREAPDAEALAPLVEQVSLNDLRQRVPAEVLLGDLQRGTFGKTLVASLRRGPAPEASRRPGPAPELSDAEIAFLEAAREIAGSQSAFEAIRGPALQAYRQRRTR
jgi:hypothetical protein